MTRNEPLILSCSDSTKNSLWLRLQSDPLQSDAQIKVEINANVAVALSNNLDLNRTNALFAAKRDDCL